MWSQSFLQSFHQYFLQWLSAVWIVFQEASPWLLAGLVAATLLRLTLVDTLVARWVQGRGIGSVLRGAFVGVPLPLCSCGVLPVAAMLRRGGAGRGAVASFLVSTPEIGVDSFLLSSALLGMTLAWTRVGLAFVAAVAVGLLVERFGDETAVLPPSAGCGGGVPCCCETPPSGSAGITSRFGAAYRAIWIDFLGDIGFSFLIGVALAGLLTVLLPPELFHESTWASTGMIALLLLASIPLYVCASGSTPIAAVLLHHGASAGSVLVFLLAGPATNIPTLMLMARELGRKNTVLYVSGVLSVSLLLGFAVDRIGFLSLPLPVVDTVSGHADHNALALAATALLLLLLAHALWLRFRSRSSAPAPSASGK